MDITNLVKLLLPQNYPVYDMSSEQVETVLKEQLDFELKKAISALKSENGKKGAVVSASKAGKIGGRISKGGGRPQKGTSDIK